MKQPTHKSFKTEAFQMAGIKEGYKTLEEEFALIAELIRARKLKGKSQKEVAELMNAPPSVVSRLEAGYGKQRHSPSLDTLRRYAKALDCCLSIRLVPNPRKAKKTRY